MVASEFASRQRLKRDEAHSKKHREREKADVPMLKFVLKLRKLEEPRQAMMTSPGALSTVAPDCSKGRCTHTAKQMARTQAATRSKQARAGGGWVCAHERLGVFELCDAAHARGVGTRGDRVGRQEGKRTRAGEQQRALNQHESSRLTSSPVHTLPSVLKYGGKRDMSRYL